MKDKQEPFLGTIDYYKDRDPKRAVEIAELGLKKCKDDQTDLIIFLIRDARINGDKARESRFLKSAKTRKTVNLSIVQEALDMTF